MIDLLKQNHVHKYYFTTSKKEFEPINPDSYGDVLALAGLDLYEMVEYAVLMCNSPCNDVKKVIIHKETSYNE
jgi:hypothetical protein